MLCVKNGMIHDALHKEAFRGDILVKDGKIAAIGENLEIPESAEIVDAEGLQVYPGFVEAHGHIGLDGYGIGYEGMDYNEMNDIISPQMRGIDGVKPMDPAFAMARAAGVTCVCVGPGSANVLGGTFTTVKTVGRRVDDMVVRDGVAMKCAFGENPKRVYKDKKDSSRMTTAALLRDALFKAREYMEKKEAAGDDMSKRPAFDMKHEALIPVLKREIPLKAHAHAAEDIFTALRIAKEFDLKITLEHVTEGHLIAEELAKEGFPAIVGPDLASRSKIEVQNMAFKTVGVLNKAGLMTAVTTDHPVSLIQSLPLCAGLAVKAGLDMEEGYKAITIHPAVICGVGHRVGSLEAGKDADIAVFDGNPMEVFTNTLYTIIDGQVVYDRAAQT